MGELVIFAIIWFVFRMIMSGVKKQKVAQQKAAREESGAGYQPKPAKVRGFGEWADMLGKLVGEEEPAAQRPAAPATPWQNESAFPPAPRPSVPALVETKQPMASRLDTSLFEDASERDVFTPAKPTREAPAMGMQDYLPERWDAPTLVKGVIFAEILTRPVQRRRPGMRRA